jgi:hypothetical protein
MGTLVFCGLVAIKVLLNLIVDQIKQLDRPQGTVEREFPWQD